jgi:hypothetical protein
MPAVITHRPLGGAKSLIRPEATYCKAGELMKFRGADPAARGDLQAVHRYLDEPCHFLRFDVAGDLALGLSPVRANIDHVPQDALAVAGQTAKLEITLEALRVQRMNATTISNAVADHSALQLPSCTWHACRG